MILRALVITISISICLSLFTSKLDKQTVVIKFDRYHRYQEIQDYLLQLSAAYPKIVKLHNYGLSVERRNLTYIKISTGGNHRRPIIFIDSTIHGREWICLAQAVYMISQLVQNQTNYKMIDNIDWIFVPLVNPDGYEYTHTYNRFWRKNRAKGKICNGVDLNRNFEFQWMQIGASSDECSNVYGGTRPFSEPESLALSQLIIEYARRIKMYITFHSAAQSILYPWGYTNDLPQNSKELHQLAAKVSEAIYKINSDSFKVGSSANALYMHSGSSRDWAYAVGNIKYSYTIEMKPNSANVTGVRRFDIPVKEILNVVSEMFEGIKVFHGSIEVEHRSILTKLKRLSWT